MVDHSLIHSKPLTIRGIPLHQVPERALRSAMFRIVHTAPASMIATFRAVTGFIPSPDGQIFIVPRNMNKFDCLDLLLGNYEKPETETMKNMGSHKMVIEIGSNIGVVARTAFREKLLPGGSYICVEPNPASQAALLANMKWTKKMYPGKDYTIVQAAICTPENDGGKNDGFGDYIQRNNLGSGLHDHTRRMHDDVDAIRVPVMSLDRLMNEKGVTNAALICDGEGVEHLLLQDPKALARVDEAVIELHHPSHTGWAMGQTELVAAFAEQGLYAHARNRDTYYFNRTAPLAAPDVT